MKESENIAAYILIVDEIVNSITGLGEEFNESMIVQKVLRSLPLRYDAKVSAIEESRDFTKLTMDELHGILTAYKMRINIENEQPTTRETIFKASNKTRNKGHKEEETSEEEWEEKEEAKLVRKLKRGIGRYKGKLPFKCFNCGRIGHYAKSIYSKEYSFS